MVSYIFFSFHSFLTYLLRISRTALGVNTELPEHGLSSQASDSPRTAINKYVMKKQANGTVVGKTERTE